MNVSGGGGPQTHWQTLGVDAPKEQRNSDLSLAGLTENVESQQRDCWECGESSGQHLFPGLGSPLELRESWWCYVLAAGGGATPCA